MTFEEALEAWVIRHAAWALPDNTETLRNFTVKYEEGFGNDSGTYWPASIEVVFQAQAPSKKTGKLHWYKRSVMATTSDPVDFMRELFEVSE